MDKAMAQRLAEAQEAARKLQADTMGKVTGGLGGLPGLGI